MRRRCGKMRGRPANARFADCADQVGDGRAANGEEVSRGAAERGGEGRGVPREGRSARRFVKRGDARCAGHQMNNAESRNARLGA